MASEYGNNIVSRQKRGSGIELLKIFGILLIVISHVTQTLTAKNQFINYQGYILDLSIATLDVQQLILSILLYSGVAGNTIFFVCSAWFLLESDSVNVKKWFNMLYEIWAISVGILIITYVLRGGNIDVKLVITSLFPTTFANNWYMTCYLLFYPIHTILNKIIYGMNRMTLFRTMLVLSILYIGFDFIKADLFFSSSIILWITLYFVIAYVKIYLKDIFSKDSFNLVLLIAGITGHIGLVLLTNLLGLHIDFFADKLLHWNNNCNPFIIITIIALFHLVRKAKFSNKVINYLSGLSFIIYIVHENIILRTYYRPFMLNYIYEKFGYDNVLFWMLSLAIIIFVVSVIVSSIYDVTLRKLVKKSSSRLYKVCNSIREKFEQLILKVH